MRQSGERLIGSSEAIRKIDRLIDEAARSDAKVLITGESGSGKEVVARLIHQNSRRCAARLLTLNCAGVPDSLLESELFVHVRGAFTGAYRDKLGLLELAHRGTIFMDEIGEMSLRMQALLLRFLETGEIHRVGSDTLHGRMDVRVISATNRDLRARIEAGEFREDLYYRVNVIHLHVPPLRERRDDVPDFVQFFPGQHFEGRSSEIPRVEPKAMARLMEYDWPGNVRELKNIVERVLVRCTTGVITAADLPVEVSGVPGTETRVSHARRGLATTAAALFDRIVRGDSFWNVVYEPFMARDLTRDDVRSLVALGLGRTHGSYRLLVELFNMPAADYKRFLNFLRKYHCQVPFQQFRGLAPNQPSEAEAAENRASSPGGSAAPHPPATRR